jgi:hypothetical protein
MGSLSASRRSRGGSGEYDGGMLYATHLQGLSGVSSHATLCGVLLLAAVTTLGCGGKVSAQTDNDGGGSGGGSGSASSGSGSGGGSSGSNGSSSGSDSSDAGGSDAQGACSLPPISDYGGTCTLCDGDWYCPKPRTPQPPCPPGTEYASPCTSTCVECQADGSAIYYPTCSMGVYSPGGVYLGFSCSPP